MIDDAHATKRRPLTVPARLRIASPRIRHTAPVWNPARRRYVARPDSVWPDNSGSLEAAFVRGPAGMVTPPGSAIGTSHSTDTPSVRDARFISPGLRVGRRVPRKTASIDAGPRDELVAVTSQGKLEAVELDYALHASIARATQTGSRKRVSRSIDNRFAVVPGSTRDRCREHPSIIRTCRDLHRGSQKRRPLRSASRHHGASVGRRRGRRRTEPKSRTIDPIRQF